MIPTSRSCYVVLRRPLASVGCHSCSWWPGPPAERKQVLGYVSSGHVDGVLLISSHANDPVVDALVSRGIPAIACGAPLGFESRVGYVSADDLGWGTADDTAPT